MIEDSGDENNHVMLIMVEKIEYCSALPRFPSGKTATNDPSFENG
mgnify:CR=1 FL=1